MARARRILQWFDARRRAVVVAMTGWIVLTVVAGGSRPDDDAWVGLSALRYVGWAAALIAGGFGLILLIAALLGRGEVAPRSTEKRSRWWWVPFAVAGLLLLVLDPKLPDRDSADDAEQAEEHEEARVEPSDTVDPFDVFGLIFGVLLAGGIIWWSRGRLATEADEPAERMPPVAEVADAIEQAADYLLDGRDPRTAVLNAYAVLERSLAAQGEGRDQAETPTEHLARVLDTLEVDSESVTDLGSLYERARFSSEPISPDDQRRAGLALRRIQASLTSTNAAAR